MLLTVDGMDTEDRLIQFWKVSAGMLEACPRDAVCRLLHPANRLLPITVTVLGMDTPVRDVLFANTLALMVVTPLGMEILPPAP